MFYMFSDYTAVFMEETSPEPVLQDSKQLQDNSRARAVFQCVVLVVAVFCLYRVCVVLRRDGRMARAWSVCERCSIS